MRKYDWFTMARVAADQPRRWVVVTEDPELFWSGPKRGIGSAIASRLRHYDRPVPHGMASVKKALAGMSGRLEVKQINVGSESKTWLMWLPEKGER